MTESAQNQAIKKGAVGAYSYWLAGRNKWEIRNSADAVLAIKENLSEAAALCKRLYDRDKAEGLS